MRVRTIHVPATLLELGILYDRLHDDSSMNHVSLLLHKAVPPGRREPPGDHQSQGGIGVHGSEILLDPLSDAGGHALLVDLREFAGHHSIQEPCMECGIQFTDLY